MAGLLIKSIYILASLSIGVYLYYWSSVFKKIGSSTLKELNEDENGDDLVNESETKAINYFGIIVFILIGITIWSFIGVTIGRIASIITLNVFLKWIVYVLMFFVFLRFPFGFANKMVKKSHDFEHFPEKIFFSFTMIVSYILSICCFESIPNFLKFHLGYLN